MLEAVSLGITAFQNSTALISPIPDPKKFSYLWITRKKSVETDPQYP